MKRFLYATDFSKASDNAFEYTKNLIKGTDIIIDMIHVYDIPIAYSTQTPTRAIQGYKKELEEAAIRRLKKLMDKLPEANHGTIYPLYGIYPSVEIDECAQVIESDMIIMALRKDYGLLKRFIGSTTAKTIHKSLIPIMAIPSKSTFSTISQILFPTSISVQSDLSERELKAIEWLSGFSGFLNHPNIELIHIVEDRSAIDVNVTCFSSFEKLRLTHSHAMTVEEGILSYMNEQKPDLLAFYKPQRTFWERLYRPSKTRHILYDSHIPLIIFG